MVHVREIEAKLPYDLADPIQTLHCKPVAQYPDKPVVVPPDHPHYDLCARNAPAAPAVGDKSHRSFGQGQEDLNRQEQYTPETEWVNWCTHVHRCTQQQSFVPCCRWLNVLQLASLAGT